MDKIFEELDCRETPLGELSLRRRKVPLLEDQVVYEIKLNDEFLMSSLFHEVEVALADLALERTPDGPLDVVVGGLGLGYTAQAALKHPRVRSLRVIEYLQPVIEWHQTGLVPLGNQLSGDPRTKFLHLDFFSAANPGQGFDPEAPGRTFHALLLDIDHTPGHWLSETHAAFYTPEGFRNTAAQLVPGGIFAMWSDAPPDDSFRDSLSEVFENVESHQVRFDNPLRGGSNSNTVYLARRRLRRPVV